MNRNFMIGFMYEGYFYCANVHKYKISPTEYHITILASKLRDGVPSRIILKDNGNGPQQSPQDGISPTLVNTIIQEIEKKAEANS